MNKKSLSLLPLAALLCACGGATSSSSNGGTVTITDAIGREVTLVPGKAERIVCIGAGALRLYSYVGDPTKICGIERIEVEKGEGGEFGYLNSPYAIRPYQKVFGHYWTNLPSCGTGGPKAQVVEEEEIFACRPDLIISAYENDLAGMDQLSADLNVPVVTISYGETEAFDPKLLESIEILGQALGREERAEQLVDYIKGMEEDLQNRQKDIPEEDRPTVYLACQANYGLKSFGSSSAQYSIFDAAGVRNYLDEKGLTGYQPSVNLEDLVVDSPDKIILDASGLQMLKADYQVAETKEVIESIKAVQNGEVYLQMPYNSYYTNLEIAYADAYFAGKVCFPEEYEDIDMTEKANEITKMFLGVDFYSNPDRDDDITDVIYGGFAKVEPSLEEFLNERVA